MNKVLFTKRLTELINANGISARDLSLKIGQNSGYINSIENGRAYPSMEVFFKICEELDITPVDFFDLDNKHPERLGRLIPFLDLLSEDEYNNIALIIEALADKNK
ncbi:MAG: helix-turn-helix transcriptional regulator [Eubacterium sp.]|nr:helix-turn-helix transcriptional regulator [Eubacterium sp.]